jgi:hypothetical protein
MDHQAFAQRLGSYGEFVGAIAVVVTLIYFGVQLRKTELPPRTQPHQQCRLHGWTLTMRGLSMPN